MKYAELLRRYRGFTLTELLTTIAIVAVLAGLVLTALPMAMRKARDIDCRSNLKQHGLAILGFLADNSVYPVYFDNGSVSGDRTLIGALGRALGRIPTQQTTGGAAYRGQFRSVWICPAAMRQQLPPDYPSNRGRPGIPYGYNVAGLGPAPRLPGQPLLGLGGTEVVDHGWVSSPPVNESAVVSPSRMICMGDDVVGSNGVFQDEAPWLGRRAVGDFFGSNERVKTRHGGKLNILFCDGRVDALTLGFLFSDPSDGALSLWNRDHQPHRELLP